MTLTGHEALRLFDSIERVESVLGGSSPRVFYRCLNGRQLTLDSDGYAELSAARPSDRRTLWRMDQKTARARMAHDAGELLAVEQEKWAAAADKMAEYNRAKAAQRRTRMDLRASDLRRVDMLVREAAAHRADAAAWRALSSMA